MRKTCFVIMPIKSPGTKEHTHYRALFDTVISPTVSSFGYDVKRADDFQASGSISKDIIVPLATYNLVVADLTGLNPNVFYELGVRHALMGKGTIMIMDEAQSEIPFDIHAYRVIKFRSDVAGIGDLHSELSSYIRQIEEGQIAQRDNLVHDWLPKLPSNIYSYVTTGKDDDQLKDIERLQQYLKLYVDRYGELREPAARASPRQLIRNALEEAKKGGLPEQIVERAEEYAEQRNILSFLEQVDNAINLRTLVPSKSHFRRLRMAAWQLDLHYIEAAIIDQAHVIYPDDDLISLQRLTTYAHSEDSTQLIEAVEGFRARLGIRSDSPPEFSRHLNDSDLQSFGVMLDAYHRL